MGERRQGDRREKEKGVIKVSFRTAIISIVLAITIIGSVSLNIIFYKRLVSYEEYIERINEMHFFGTQDITE